MDAKDIARAIENEARDHGQHQETTQAFDEAMKLLAEASKKGNRSLAQQVDKQVQQDQANLPESQKVIPGHITGAKYDHGHGELDFDYRGQNMKMNDRGQISRDSNTEQHSQPSDKAKDMPGSYKNRFPDSESTWERVVQGWNAGQRAEKQHPPDYENELRAYSDAKMQFNQYVSMHGNDFNAEERRQLAAFESKLTQHLSSSMQSYRP